MGPLGRVIIVLLCVGGLLGASLPAAARVPAVSHASAVSAKQTRCRGGKKARHRRACKKKAGSGSGTSGSGTAGSGSGTGTGSGTGSGSGTQPTATPEQRFAAMFDNSGWDRQYVVSTGDGRESLYNFCSSGNYFQRWTNQTTSSESNYTGSWTLQSVQSGVVNGISGVEGRVNYTAVDQYGNNDSGTIVVDLSEQYPNQALINGNEYTRVAPGAC